MARLGPSAAAQAAAAARGNAHGTPSAPGADDRWDRDRVLTAAAVFAELPRLPAWDHAPIGERVRAWYRFVDVVAAGRVDVDAAPLAAEVLRLGAAFLAAHPQHLRIGGARWTEDDVAAVARWFGTVMAGEDVGGDDVRTRIEAFGHVVRSALVDDDARDLAEVLLDAMAAWRA